MAVGLAYPSSALDDKEERMEENVRKTNKVLEDVDFWTKTRHDLEKARLRKKGVRFCKRKCFFLQKNATLLLCLFNFGQPWRPGKRFLGGCMIFRGSTLNSVRKKGSLFES